MTTSWPTTAKGTRNPLGGRPLQPAERPAYADPQAQEDPSAGGVLDGHHGPLRQLRGGRTDAAVVMCLHCTRGIRATSDVEAETKTRVEAGNAVVVTGCTRNSWVFFAARWGARHRFEQQGQRLKEGMLSFSTVRRRTDAA